MEIKQQQPVQIPITNGNHTVSHSMNNLNNVNKPVNQINQQVHIQPQFQPQPSQELQAAPINHQSNGRSGQPPIVKIRLNKKNNGLGLSIVGATGTNQANSGIYIKSVVPGGAAADDGRLTAGDQLLAVDEFSLINVSQEKAAELMTKSGPVVILTIAKDAASYHDLEALLNKPPQPQQQQQQQPANQSIAASMPALNNNQQYNNQQQNNIQQNNFTTATLPRNHHQFNQMNGNFMNQQQQQLQQQTQPQQQFNDGIDSSSYRVRSMSQEVLRSNVNGTPSAASVSNLNQNGSNSNGSPVRPPSVTNPIMPRSISNTNGQVTSPTHHQPYYRGLPNEQQIRYGSERPVSIHQSATNDNRYGNHNGSQIAQRNLPNEFGPRFGSERPSSSVSQRFNNPETSPVKQQHQHQQQPQPFVQARLRQASLSELDEINYNTRQSLIEQQQNQNQQQVKLEDLYGKVNNQNKYYDGQQNQVIQQQPPPQQQYKTLPSRTNGYNQVIGVLNPNGAQPVQTNGNNNHLDDQQRTKSVGQLYEQIWSNNNNNNNSSMVQNQITNSYNNLRGPQPYNPQNNIHHAQQHSYNNINSVDDLNLRQMDLNGDAQNGQIHHSHQGSQHIRNKYDFTDTSSSSAVSSTSSAASKVSRSNFSQPINPSQSTVRVIPINRVNNNNSHQDFQNGMSDQPNNLINNDFYNNKPQPPPIQQRNYENQIVNNNVGNNISQRPPVVLNNNSISNINNGKPSIPNKPFNINVGGFKQDEIDLPIQSNQSRGLLNRQERTREEDEHLDRLNLLKQRIDMLNELESKPYRTNEEENRLNKLRTEIEFDKRVIEMNNMNMNYLDETNDENDTMEYTPEVRERLANEMMQRRRRYEEDNTNGNMNALTDGSDFIKSRPKSTDPQLAARFEMEDIKKRRSDEVDRLLEMKREEIRLSRHIDLNNIKGHHMNGNSGYQNGNHNEEISVVHMQTRMQESNDMNGHQPTSNGRVQKHVQFVSESEIISPKQNGMNGFNPMNGMNGNGNYSNNSSPISQPVFDQHDLNVTPPYQNGSNPPPLPSQQPPQQPNQAKRVVFSDAKFLEFDHHNGNNMNNDLPNTPSVIGANEVYVDQRLKMKQQQLQQQQMANMFVEGEKLSFKDKMKLFAKQAGDNSAETDTKIKVSKKQREIESKFENR